MAAQRVKMGIRVLGCAIGVLALAAVIDLGPAYADDFGGTSSSAPPPEPDTPEKPCENNDCCDGPSDCCKKGEEPDGDSESPISYFNGGESITATDVVVRGVFPIRIRRKYDSRSTYDSPLGFGWAFLHDRRLYEYPDNSLLIRHGCGTRDRYVFSGGAYVSPVGGTLSTVAEQPDGSFLVHYRNGFMDHFDSQGRLIAHQDKQGNRHEYTYDPRGKLPLVGTSNSAVDPNQPMTVAQVYRLKRIDERAASGALTGRYVTFDYDENTGRLSSLSTDDGRMVTYQHDVTGGLTQGNLVQVDGLEGLVATYGYADPHNPHNLTSITSALGRTPIINTYDDQGRVIWQEEGTRRIDFDYQVPFTRTVVTRTIRDHNGQNPQTAVTTYEFDETGRITKVIDALGHEMRYTYSSAKRLIRKEIWQNDSSTVSLVQAKNWTYNAAGQKLTESVTLDSGETVTKSWTYDHDWVASEQVVSSADPSKIYRTEYTFYYGPDGRPTHIQSEKRRRDDGSFQTTAYTYDGRNRLLTTTLPDAVQIVNEYAGDQVTRTYFVVNGAPIPELERRFEYDAHGNRTEVWDGRNHLTEYGYDERGRIASVTNPLSEQTLYTYSGEQLTHLEKGRTAAAGEGQVTRFVYDARGRLTGLQRKNDAGVFIDYQTVFYDSEDRAIAVTDAENRTMWIAYNGLGRVVGITDPDNKVTEFGYDAAGNRTLIRDALGREINYEYDDLDRMIATVERAVTPNARAEYDYDAAGNLTAVTDAEGNTTTYQYDALSRNTRITQPLGQFVEYLYDDRDRVIQLLNARGERIEYDYEPWGGLAAERQYPSVSVGTAERTITYGYDNDGNATSVTDDGIHALPAYAMTYDALGRLYDETVRYLPGGNRILRHRYDRYGNRNELTLDDGAVSTYGYTFNKLNQLASANLAGAAINLSYFANDDRKSITLPNGVTETRTYRPSGPVETITLTGLGGQITQFAYTYDEALRVESLTDQYGTHLFAYDGLDRLTHAQHPSASGLADEQYAYDRVGNRQDPMDPSAYAYDGNNRITASPGLTYTFDADGSLASRSDGATFTYDARDRLVRYAKGAVTAEYLHDPGGRRIRKTVNGTDTWFLWDGSRLLAEYDASGARIQRYAYLSRDNVPAQIQDENGTHYMHADHLQTPRLASGAAGEIVWRSRHEAFGSAIVDGDPDGNGTAVVINVRFPGQYYDDESGLHYNYFRDYDPAIGRYVQSDPIGLAGGLNVYAYVRGNPILFVDPLGLYIPEATPNCFVRLFDPYEHRYDGRRDEFDEESVKVTIPIVVPFTRKEYEVLGYMEITFYWQQWIQWGLWERNQNYHYICTEKDECGEDRTTVQPGNHRFTYEKFEGQGTDRWREVRYIPPPNGPPLKFPPPFPSP